MNFILLDVKRKAVHGLKFDDYAAACDKARHLSTHTRERLVLIVHTESDQVEAIACEGELFEPDIGHIDPSDHIIE